MFLNLPQAIVPLIIGFFLNKFGASSNPQVYGNLVFYVITFVNIPAAIFYHFAGKEY